MNQLFTSKFVVLLKTFSVDELKSFERWLASPWCNSNKNLPKLLEKLSKYYPDFDNPKYTKEKLFKQILPTGKYSDRRINNLLSEAFQSAEKFIIFQGLSNEQQVQTDLLTQALQSRHLEDWFFKESDQAIARLEAKPIKDWEDHVALLKLNRRVYHHPNQKPRMLPGSPTIVKMGEQLDLVFLLEKGAIINEKISRTRLLKDEVHDITNELAVWNEAAVGIHHPSVELYKLRLNCDDSDKLESYLQFKALYITENERLNDKEQKIHQYNLLNDSVFLYKRQMISEEELLNTYKFGIDKDFFLVNGILLHNAFQLIIAFSNHINDFNYSEQFIKEYAPKLDPDIAEDALAWATGHTAYYKKDLDKSLGILVAFQFKSLFFNKMGKTLTAMVYFDLFLRDSSYQEPLFAYLDSLEKWLIREKMRSAKSRKSYIAFVQKCRALAKYYLDPNKNELKMQTQITQEESMQARVWLMNKLVEINNIIEKGRSN